MKNEHANGCGQCQKDGQDANDLRQKTTRVFYIRVALSTCDFKALANRRRLEPAVGVVQPLVSLRILVGSFLVSDLQEQDQEGQWPLSHGGSSQRSPNHFKVIWKRLAEPTGEHWLFYVGVCDSLVASDHLEALTYNLQPSVVPSSSCFTKKHNGL